MRVIYRKLCEELDEAIANSILQGKRIARFELTECEFEQLKKELRPILSIFTADSQHQQSTYNGIQIKVIK